MAAAGLTPQKVAGRRYTDEATLEIVVRVLDEIITESSSNFFNSDARRSASTM